MDQIAAAAEITRLEAATPSRIASFNTARAARLAELRAMIATMPTPVAPKDAALEAMLERADAGSAVNRRADRWR